MGQLRLVPSYFIDEFNRLTRLPAETFKSYTSRLSTLLKYYLDSKKVSTFDELIQLLICDRVKSVLPEGALSHLLRFELSLPNQWANRDQLVDVLDTYDTNYDRNDKPKASALGATMGQRTSQISIGRNPNYNQFNQQSVEVSEPNAHTTSFVSGTRYSFKPQDLADRVCFKCGEKGHVRAQCGMNPSQSYNKSFSNRKQNGNGSGTGARVFKCTVSQSQGNTMIDPDLSGELTGGLIDRSQNDVLHTDQQVDEYNETSSKVIACNRAAAVCVGVTEPISAESVEYIAPLDDVSNNECNAYF